MIVKIAAIIFVVLLSSFSNGVCRIPSAEQYSKTSIRTKYNQTYNCVPFHRQIAFSLHNLKFEVIPNIIAIQGQIRSNFGLLEANGCPLGTVPILYGKGLDSYTAVPQSGSDPHEHCHAVVRTKTNNAKKFMGTTAFMSIYKPQVRSNQWSSARIKLSNDGDSIEAGSMVNPEIFEDDLPHFYGKFSVGGKECINTQCPGFVQVNRDVPLGFVIKKYSQIGVQKMVFNTTIEKHQDDGNWWLSISLNETNIIPIGYWPKSLFSSPLAEAASQVEWGGEIYNSGATEPKPEMGSGRLADINTLFSSYFRRITVNEAYQNLQPADTEIYQDCKPFYTAVDPGYVSDYWGRVIFYGGTH